MSTHFANIVFLQTTDTEFRTWVAAMHTGFTTVGLTVASDTGQIDTTTVLTPSAAGQKRGFKMYRWNDGSTELYLRVDFGSGNDGATQPGLYFQIGWATDGAGNFTGTQNSGEYAVRFNGSATAFNTRFCKSGAALSLNINDALAGSSVNSVLMVDRSRTQSTGAVNNNGATIAVASGNSVNGPLGFVSRGYYRYIPSSGGVGLVCSAASRFAFAGPRVAATWGRGADVGVAPLVPWDAGGQPSPIGILFGSATDFSVGTTFSASLYGTSHTYRATAVNGDTDNDSRVIVIEE